MSFSVSFGPVSVALTYGVTAIQTSKKAIKIVVTEAIGIVEEIGEGITTVKPGDFIIAPLLMDVGNVMLVGQDMTVPVIVMLVIIGLMVCKQNICASNMPTGPWSKSQGNPQITQKVC